MDGVTTLPPSEPATVSVSVTGSTLHFTFGIPQAYSGAEGPQGPSGEVTLSQLNNAVLDMLSQSSANSNGVNTLAIGISDPPTQSEVQQIANKVDELIQALRR